MNSKIGQLFIIGLSGTELRKDEAQFIVQNNIGGVILFDRNVESPKQLHKLCSDIYALKDQLPEKLPLFISIDMEGGRVARLKEPFTIWPPLKNIGDIDSTSLAFDFAQCMGSELNAVGINLNFAPCTDTLTNPKNEIIGDRALSSDPEQVSKMASALVRGYIKSNIIPCAKHYPGHGNTLVDSHLDLPVEKDLSLDQLKERELIPFKKAFRARLDIVMTAHILFPQIDAENPVTLSPFFLKTLLRDEFRYRGLVISDDLDMKALRNNYSVEEIPIKALNAGCDILLYCNEPTSPLIAIDVIRKELEAGGKLSVDTINESYERVLKVKKARLTSLEIPSFEFAEKLIGCDEHQKLSENIKNKVPPEKH